MFIAYHRHNMTLTTAIKPKAIEKFHMTAILSFYILEKKQHLKKSRIVFQYLLTN
jgi:hypothetical protein